MVQFSLNFGRDNGNVEMGIEISLCCDEQLVSDPRKRALNVK